MYDPVRFEFVVYLKLNKYVSASGYITLSGIQNPKDSNGYNVIIIEDLDPNGVVCFAIIFILSKKSLPDFYKKL